jgi:hypothetical protein
MNQKNNTSDLKYPPLHFTTFITTPLLPTQTTFNERVLLLCLSIKRDKKLRQLLFQIVHNIPPVPKDSDVPQDLPTASQLASRLLPGPASPSLLLATRYIDFTIPARTWDNVFEACRNAIRSCDGRRALSEDK